MKQALLGIYARHVYIRFSEWSRGWRTLSNRARRRENRFMQNTTLPQVPWSKLFRGRRAEVWEHAKTNGNIRLSELGVLAIAAAECEPVTNLFEIGTFDGRTTLNLAMSSDPTCRLITLDLPPNTETRFAVAAGEKHMIQKAESGARFRKYTEQFPQETGKITQLFGDSASFDFAPYENSCSLVFVDGSHAYEYAMCDSRTAMKLVRPDGVILWHDYGIWEGVTRALEELEAREHLGLINIKGTSLVFWKKLSASGSTS